MNSIYFQNPMYYMDPINYNPSYHQPTLDTPYLDFNQWISINDMLPQLKQRILSYVWKHSIGSREFEDINLTYEAMELDKHPLSSFKPLESNGEQILCPFGPHQLDYILWNPTFDMTMSIFSKWIIIIRIMHAYPQIQAINSYDRLLEMFHSTSMDIIKLANDLNLFQFSIKAILQYSLDYNIAISRVEKLMQFDPYESKIVQNYYRCDSVEYYSYEMPLENEPVAYEHIDFNFQMNNKTNNLLSEDNQDINEQTEYNNTNSPYYNSKNKSKSEPQNISSPSNTWHSSDVNNDYSEAETQTPSKSDYSDDVMYSHLSKYKKICPFKIQEDTRSKSNRPKVKLPRGTPRKNLQATESKMYLHNKGYFRVMWWEENSGKRTRKEKIFPNNSYQNLGEAEQAARDFKASVDAQLSNYGKVSLLSHLTKSSSKPKKGSKRIKSEENYDLDANMDDINLELDGIYLEWYPNISIPLGEKGRNSLKKALNKKRSEDTEYCDYLLMKNNLPFLQSSTFGYFTLKDLLHAANILGLWPLAQKFCIKYCKEMGFKLCWLEELRSKGIAVTFHELKKLKAQHLESEIIKKKADLLLEDTGWNPNKANIKMAP